MFKTTEKQTKSRPRKPTVRTLDETVQLIGENMAILTAQVAETDRKLAELSEKTDMQIQQFIKESKTIIKALSTTIGNVGNELGEMVEFITLPGIRREMNKHGHHFNRSYANKKINGLVRGYKQRVAEVDLFLYDGTEAMAVEVKTSLTVEDVNTHLDRLKILRDYETESGIQGKKLYGAVIGIFIDEHAMKHALKHGLFVMAVLEDEKAFKTHLPPQKKAW